MNYRRCISIVLLIIIINNILEVESAVCGDGIVDVGEQCDYLTLQTNLVQDVCDLSCNLVPNHCEIYTAQFKDEFNNATYTNSDGNLMWNSTWVEIIDDSMDSPTMGVIQINTATTWLEIVDLGSLTNKFESFVLERQFDPYFDTTGYGNGTIKIDIAAVANVSYTITVVCNNGPGCASLPLEGSERILFKQCYLDPAANQPTETISCPTPEMNATVGLLKIPIPEINLNDNFTLRLEGQNQTDVGPSGGPHIHLKIDEISVNYHSINNNTNHASCNDANVCTNDVCIVNDTHVTYCENQVIASCSQSPTPSLSSTQTPSTTPTTSLSSTPTISTTSTSTLTATPTPSSSPVPCSGVVDTCGVCTTETTANPIIVTTTSDVIDQSDGLISLREAISIANIRTSSVDIVLSSGTYVLTLGSDQFEDLNCESDLDYYNNQSISISGVSKETTFVDGGFIGRIIDFISTSTNQKTITLSDITFQNGLFNDPTVSALNEFGGGMRVTTNSDITIENCAFTNNTIERPISSPIRDCIGGAIGINPLNGANITLDVDGSMFMDNKALHKIVFTPFLRDDLAVGGAIGGFCQSFCGVIINNTQFNNNMAEKFGGAISLEGDFQFDSFNSEYLSNFVLANSTLLTRGGAMYFASVVNITGLYVNIDNCNMTNNEVSQGSGGAIDVNAFFFDIVVNISNSIMFNNSANEDGAVAINSGGVVTVTNTLFDSNIGGERASAMCVVGDSASLLVDSCVFRDNFVEMFVKGGTLFLSDLTMNQALIQNSLFDNNMANSTIGFTAGAIMIDEMSSALIENCNFTDNFVTRSGGAITLLSTSFTTVSNCIFENNDAPSGLGGSIFITSFCNATVLDSSFNNGNSNTGGGAICIQSQAYANVERSVFTNNVGNFGGAIKSLGNFDIEDSTFSNNNGSSGGAIYVGTIGTSISTLRRSTLDNNFSSGNGDAVYIDSYELLMEQCTVSNNLGSNAVYLISQTLNITACTVAFNNNTGIFVDSGGTLTIHNTISSHNTQFDYASSGATLNNLGYNLITSDDGSFASVATDIVGVNADLEPLQNNGGLTQTHALSFCSVAINAGDNALNASLVTDQRGAGFARLVDTDVDIGSYELQTGGFETNATCLNNTYTCGSMPFCNSGTGFCNVIPNNTQCDDMDICTNDTCLVDGTCQYDQICTATPTVTPTQTSTGTISDTPTVSDSSTPTISESSTASTTSTASSTSTPSATSTASASSTSSTTSTASLSSTPSMSGTGTPSVTPTPTALNCDDMNPCTVDSVSMGMCVNTPVANGTLCDNGVVNGNCQPSDVCMGGMCVPVVNTTLCEDELFFINPCYDFLGCGNVEPYTCMFQTNMLPCDDGNECSVNDTCVSGECVGGPLMDCNDMNDCTLDKCFNETSCLNLPLSDNGYYRDMFETVAYNNSDGTIDWALSPNNNSWIETNDDQSPNSPLPSPGIFVSSGENFIIGVSTPVVLNNTLVIHTQDASGAVNQTIERKAPINMTSLDTATLSYRMRLNLMVLGVEVSSDGINFATLRCYSGLSGSNTSVCTDETGTPTTFINSSYTYFSENIDISNYTDLHTTVRFREYKDGDFGITEIDYVQITINLVPCDDGDMCTIMDACNNGTCVSGMPLNCDDGNPCTLDSCDSILGCVNVPDISLNGTLCRASSGICDLPEVCDGISAMCPPDIGVPNGLPCDDSDICTTADQCINGTCTGTQLPNTTIDCGIYGCVNNMTNQLIGQNPSLCADDGNPCTMDSCQNGTCVYNATSADGMLCQDGKDCTVGDTCQSGECVSGSDLCDECIVRAGSDAFSIGHTLLDYFTSNPIPSNFFGPGSDPFSSVITMIGDGVDFVEPFAAFDNIDLIVERLQDADLVAPSGTDMVPIEIVALSLESIQPITVTFGAGQPQLWEVNCDLSENNTQPSGVMNITASDCSCNDGGTFVSLLTGPQELLCNFVNTTNNNTLSIDSVQLTLLPDNIVQHWYRTSSNGGNTTVLTGTEYVIDQYGTGTTNRTITNSCEDFYPGVRLDQCDDTCVQECQMDSQCNDGLTCTTDTCLLPSGMCINTYDPPIGQSCYTGPPITQNVGTCKDGVFICQEPSGTLVCVGEVLPQTSDTPNDGLDTDCDGSD